MNERIKELIDQATIPVIETNDYNGMAYETYQFSQELFAELIVSEAVAKIQSVGYKSSNDIPFDTTDLFVRQVKQHFGVK